MRRRLTTVLTGCLLLGLIAPWAQAEIINGQYVPPGLNVGDQYRLVFVTSGVIDAESDIAEDYDTFLFQQVAGTALDDSLGTYNWKAVVSTYTFSPNYGHRDAKNVVMDPVGSNLVGVYNTLGEQVDVSGNAMLNGSLLTAVRYDQNGVDKGPNAYVWTGSDAAGNPMGMSTQYSDRLNTLGAPQTPGLITIGLASASDGRWLNLVNVPPNLPNLEEFPFTAAIYGISDVLTVPVPEPATCVMWLMLSGIGGVVFWRRRRNSS